MTPKAAAAQVLDALPRKKGRMLVSISGAPASGKSTLAEELVAMLVETGHKAVLVPMDGFHLDNAVLEARGLVPRKGAPQTFDLGGFLTMVRRLTNGNEVVVPLFDRTRDIAIAGVQVVPADAEIVIVEGNYLSLDDDGWRDLADLWDYSVFLDVEEGILEQRLIQRWLDHGHDQASAERRALSNDIPNARLVARRRLPADLVLKG